MATIQEAIEYSKKNPTSAFANELKRRIESGQMNNELESAGLKQYISTPTPQAEPTLGSKLMERGKTLAKEATGQPVSDILQNTDHTSAKDILGAGSEALLRTAQAPIRALGAVGGAIGDVVGAGIHATGLDKTIGEVVQPVVDSHPVQKAMEVFKTLPQDTQDVLGAILNTANIPLTGAGASVIKNGVETGVKELGQGVKTGIETVAPKIIPDSGAIMQRVARVSKGKQASFEKQAGESIGSFLDKRGIYGDIDQITQKLYDRFQTSKQTADDALAELKGTYRAPQIRTALHELDGKVERTSSAGAPDADLARVKELVAKERTQGLTMPEVNEVKRLYEKRVRLDYVKTNAPEDVTRATNVDTALRNWQFTEAEKAGLKNLPEINKETMLNKKLLDDIGAEHSGSAGNNAISLTDYILLAGGDPTSAASFITKKVLDSRKVQSAIAKKISKNKDKLDVPKAQFKEKLQLEAPKTDVKVGNNVPIPLSDKTVTASEKEMVAKLGKKYGKVYILPEQPLALPSPKKGSPLKGNNVPIKVKPTQEKDISKGFPKKK